MSTEWSFRNLDLTGVEASTGGRLKEGRHVCKITKAVFKDNASGNGKILELEYTAEDGSGSITEFLNIFHPNPTAQEIGRRRLKSVLTYSGHPNPDRPENVNSMKGLKVGIVVAKVPREWTDKNGKVHSFSHDVSDGAAYFPVDSGPEYVGAGSKLNDSIPF